MVVKNMVMAAVIGVALAAGRPAVAGPLPLGLAQIVERAAAESPLVRAGDAEVEQAEAQVRAARAQRWIPEAKLALAGGLVPEARGTIADSPDTQRDLDGLGPYYRAEITLVQPLWTFGRLDGLERLAVRGRGVAEAARELTVQDVVYGAVRFYWALAAAEQGGTVARQMRRDFDKLRDEVVKRLADDTSEVDDEDLLQVKAGAFAVDQVVLEAFEAREAARDALQVMLALPPGSEPVPANEPPPEFALEESRVEDLAAEATAGNSRVRALSMAAEALAAKIELQRAERNPLLFVAAGLGYGVAANRDEQDNPWASDPFNFSRVGAELGLAFDLNRSRANAALEGARAEHRALLERLAALRSQVGVEFRSALREARRGQALLESVRASLKAAKSRLRLTLDVWELGLGEVDDVLDAYEGYYALRAEEPRREYAFHVALARIGHVLGDLGRYARWVEDGRVAL